MADPSLLRAFRFRVQLRRSAGGAGAAGAASAGISAGVSASFSASASVGAGGLGAAASASFSAGVGLGVGAIGGPAGDQLGDGGFQECTGLEIEQDVAEYLPGGENDRVVQRVGRAKYQNLVLKRGMLYSAGAVNPELWQWIQNVVRGVRPVPRYDGTVQVMSVGEAVVATWHFSRGLPARIRGPTLNAQTGEIAIEELHIAHEGLVLGDA